MPYPNEHAARIRRPSKKRYIRYGRQNDKFGEGIHAIFGVKPDQKTELQAIRFDRKRFTITQAKKWLADHNYKPLRFEAAIEKTKITKPEKGRIVKMLKPTRDEIAKLTNEELIELHRRCHQWEEKSRPTVRDVHIDTSMGSDAKLPDQELYRLHRRVVAEMTRRGLEHETTDDLDRGLAKEVLNWFKGIIKLDDKRPEGPEANIEWSIPIVKADEEQRLVYGVVLRPDMADSQGDVYNEDEVRKAAHQYLVKSRRYDWKHKELVPEPEVEVVESFLAPQEMWEGKVQRGDWVVVSHVVNDQKWQAMKGGDVAAYSIRGWGKRKAIIE